MKNWLYLAISVIVIALSLFLRLYKIENRAPFDWDQNRDYLAIAQIVEGKPTLIGPVAKGEGGFFLGPLYYYLSVPGFVLSRGNPQSLPVTSVVLDVIAIVAILALFPRVWGKYQSILLALAWSLSWFAIEMSRISWNVALLQVWLISFIYLISLPLSSWKALLFGLILGITWHIHAVIIPLSLLIGVIYLKKLEIKWIHLLYMGVGYLLALSPLILFDIRHAGLEHNLVLQFLSENGSTRPPISDVLNSTLSRFGKNTLTIFTGTSELSLITGIVATFMAILAIMRGTRLAKISGQIILIDLVLVLYLGEIRFPEYYLASAYLPVLIIAIDFTSHFKAFIKPLAFVVVGLFLYFNFHHYSTQKTSFSLVQKQDLVHAVSRLGNNVDLHSDLPFGRDSGIALMLKHSGVSVSKQAKTQVLITESIGESVFIGGEIAEDLGWFGGFRLAYHVVQ